MEENKNEEKNIDGIKKYDSKNLRKAREIVLKTIGEKTSALETKKAEDKISEKEFNMIEEKTAQLGKKDVNGKKKFDGIFRSKAKDIRDTATYGIESASNTSAYLQKNDAAEKAGISGGNSENAKKVIIAETKGKKNNKDQDNHGIRSDQAKKECLINKMKKIKKSRSAADNSVKSKKKAYNKFTGDVNADLPEASFAAQTSYTDNKKRRIKEKEEKKREREKARKRKSAKEKKQKGIKGHFILTFKILYYAILVFLIALIIFYIAFFVAVYSFNLDNKISRKIAKFIPIPALITKIGIVEYYEYIDAEQKLKQYYSNRTEEIPSQKIISEQAKAKLIKEIVIERLAEKYGLDLSNSDELAKKLEERMALDAEINYSVLARANKLKKMIESGEAFYQVARRYGDDFNLGAYYSEQEAREKFGDGIINLEINQISNAIATSKGYYIVECYSKQNNLIGLRHILIKPKSLDDYTREVMLELRVRSFVG